MAAQSKPVEEQSTPPTEQTEQPEPLPISNVIKVLDSVTIFKSKKWWEAITIIESYGRRSIAMYLWVNKNGKWKRQHKFQIRNQQEWENVKNAVDKLAPKLFGETPKPQP